MLNTVIVFTENKHGILYRIADVFLKRKINIESLTVSKIEEKNMSRFTVVIDANIKTLQKGINQLNKIIEVIDVINTTNDKIVYREIALIKVNAKKTPEKIEKIIKDQKAKIISKKKNSFIVELSGTEEAINKLSEKLRTFGILEYVRSGRIALMN